MNNFSRSFKAGIQQAIKQVAQSIERKVRQGVKVLVDAPRGKEEEKSVSQVFSSLTQNVTRSFEDRFNSMFQADRFKLLGGRTEELKKLNAFNQGKRSSDSSFSPVVEDLNLCLDDLSSKDQERVRQEIKKLLK